MKRQIIIVTLVLTMCLSLMNINAAATPSDLDTLTTSGLDLLDKLLSRQFESLVSGAKVKTSDIFIENDNTLQYQLFLEWRIAEAVILGVTYDEYTYNMVLDSAIPRLDSLELTATVNSEYLYTGNPNQYGQWGMYYTVSIVDTSNGIRISAIDTNEVMYDEFSRNILSINDIQKSKATSLNKVADKIDDLYIVAEQMKKSSTLDDDFFSKEESNTINQIKTDAPPNAVAALTSYTYNASNGVAYANKYYKDPNPCFYNAVVDCTNFVSQCIWAAYGGWSSSDTTSTMEANIKAKKRMMDSTSSSNWFAGSGGGGSPWESVNALWNFVTSSPSEGPKATGYNNNASYSYIDRLSIQEGNVLQVRRSSDGNNNYGHSVYVIYAVGIDDWNEIGVAQHTSNTTRSVADLIAGWGGTACYMRRLAFTSAYFQR